MSIERKALLMIFIIPVLWGATFPLIHKVVAVYNPVVFVYWRFLVSSIILLPVLILAICHRQIKRIELIYGLLIGFMNSGAFILQSIALQYVDSSRTAFLTGVNVVLVPLLIPFFALAKPKKIELIAAVLCLFGIYLLSGADFTHYNIGDILVLGSALCIALGIILVEKASRISQNLMLLTFYQISLTLIIPIGLLGKQTFNLPTGNLFWVGIAYCGLFATVIPLFLQMKYQKYVGSSRAAVIFSLEAVSATFFAWLVGEQIALDVILGGGLVLLSSILPDLYRIVIGNKSSF